MKLLFNSDMRNLLTRCPIEPGYRGSRRADVLRLRRTPSLHYVSSRPALAPKAKAHQPAAGARPQDIDVARTRMDFARVAQKNFSSAAFHALWTIAHSSANARPGVCALVSIMDDAIIEKVAREWVEFEPLCALAFFRGSPTSYFGDIQTTVGAQLILALDSLDWSGGFARFAATIASITP